MACGYDRTRKDIIEKTVKTTMEMRRRFHGGGWTVRDANTKRKTEIAKNERNKIITGENPSVGSISAKYLADTRLLETPRLVTGGNGCYVNNSIMFGHYFCR